jgi:CheY-like chemotaxis protein
VPLVDVLASAVETSRPLIEQMGHELTITPPDEPVVVDADLTRLAQVFLNLLNNAAKYSDRGGRIWLRAERQGSNVVVSVRDTGIGIPAEQLPRIFEMFSQVDHSLEKSQGGLGIGLTLVRQFVEMHGGSVEARSEGPGRGSEFLVRLPIVEDACVARRTNGEEAGKASLRILIVDDNRDGADSLAMMLKFTGNDTRTAYDGEDAVSAAALFRPDVILMDIGMPRLNGNEACRRIREQTWQRQPIIIAQTGWGQEGDRQRTQDAGFDFHLVKPVDVASLMKLLVGLKASDQIEEV